MDVTLAKLKEAEQELLQASKMISLGQMAAGAVHEVKNVLFVIAGQIEVLEMEENLSPVARQTVTSMHKQVGILQDIVRGILEYAKKKEVKFQEIDSNKVLIDSIRLLKYQLKARDNVRVAEELCAEPLMISGDENQLREVFLNLMMNAAQAMEDKGGILTVKSFKKTDAAVFEFRDTGKGMDAATLEKIFKPFFTTKAQGTGLGLSLCHKIVEAHQGEISVESQPGEGAVFIVRLPLLKK